MERNPIIHSPAEALPAAGVAFCCQYGSVAQQKLDLLQLASRFMAYRPILDHSMHLVVPGPSSDRPG